MVQCFEVQLSLESLPSQYSVFFGKVCTKSPLAVRLLVFLCSLRARSPLAVKIYLLNKGNAFCFFSNSMVPSTECNPAKIVVFIP